MFYPRRRRYSRLRRSLRLRARRTRRPMRRMRKRPIQANRRILSFKRQFVANTNMSLSNTGPTVDRFFYKLDDMPSYQEFTELFDQYRIKGIKLVAVPRFTQHDLNPADTAVYTEQSLYTFINRTETSVSTLDEALQFSTVRRHSPWKPIKRYFKPSTLDTQVNNGGGTSNSIVKYGDWINTGNPSVLYFGLGYYLPKLEGVAPEEDFTLNYDVNITFYFQVKSTK